MEWTDGDGTTALMISVMNNDIQMAHTLLGKNANIHALDQRKRTVLSMARTVPMARLLLDFGANVNAYVYDNLTEIMAAQTPQIVALLVHRGANVHMRSKRERKTALSHTLLVHKSKRLARIMIAHGADVNATDDYGWSARKSLIELGFI